MCRGIVLLSLLFISLLDSAYCQVVKFSHITTDDGLMSGNPLSIVQDYQGLFWFGTEEGLQRYDGRSFKTYLFDRSDSTSLSSNFVPILYEDSHRNLWVGTFDAGLCLYDRDNDRFLRFQHDPDDNTSLLGNFIRMVFESKDGTLYIGIEGKGLSAFKIPSKITGNLSFRNFVLPASTQQETNRWISSMVETDHSFLVAVNGDGILEFSPERGTFISTLKDTVNTHTQCMFVDSKGRMWVGTWEDGVYVIDKKANRIAHHISKNGDGYLTHNQVLSVTEDKDGNFWIGTDDGLCLIRSTKDPFGPAPFIALKHSEDEERSLLSNGIKFLYIDDQERIWVASYFGGINIYDKHAPNFNSVVASKSNPQGLNHDNVYAIALDSSRRLWIGTDGGGVNLVEDPSKLPSTDVFTKIPISHEGKPVLKIKCLRPDAKGNLWIGTWGQGLFRLNLHTGSSEHVDIVDNAGKKLQTKEVLSIETDEAGNLWIGTFSFGVIYYDLRHKVFKQFRKTVGTDNEREINKVNDIQIDYARSSVWVAREGGGLCLIDLRSDAYTVVEKGPLTRNLTITSLLRDSTGQLWVGTNGAGVVLYNQETQSTVSYNVANGLLSNTVESMIKDGSGELWLGTNKGLCSITTNNGQISCYTKNDGLPGSQFSHNATCQLSDGTVVFGSVKGITLFRPNEIRTKYKDPPVVFTQLKVNNEDVAISPESPIKQNITVATEIELDHEQNSLSVEFAPLNYNRPSTTQYSYILDNFNRDWIELGSDRRITFTNIPPGNYELKIRRTSEGVISDTIKSIKLTVHPAWWQTKVFRISLSALIAALIYIIFQMRLKYLHTQRIILKREVADATAEVRNKNEQLTEIVAEVGRKNLLLEQQHMDLISRDQEIKTQNEELTAQNELILIHKKELEGAHSQLQALNGHLEQLVERRTKSLEETIVELDTVVAELDRFVYSASHDLSAPLKSVMGVVHLARVETDPEQLNLYYSYIERSVRKLEHVIEQLVLFSRNSHQPVAKLQVNLHRLINDVIEELSYWPEAASVKLCNESPADAAVITDQGRIKVILHNLVSNGIKYANKSRTNPSVWIQTTVGDNEFVLTVKDNGIGIRKDLQPRIFEMFYKASELSNGAGLGLFIVKENVSKLNGAISVVSHYGEGTRFQLTIPT